MKHRASTAAAARRRDRRARTAAKDLEEVMVDVVARQTRRVVTGFKARARTLAAVQRQTLASGSDPTPPVKANGLWKERDWDDALQEAEMLISDFVVGELETDFGIKVASEQPFVRNVVARQVSHIEDWTLDFKNLVTRTVEQGHRNLKSVDEVADDLMQAGVRTQRQANAIARTEMVAASNAASYKGAAAFAGPGDRKEWVATPDSRTRPDHKKADGQVVPFDEPFIVGGERGDHPGDRSFSAKNLVNCRCTFKWLPGGPTAEELPPQQLSDRRRPIDEAATLPPGKTPLRRKLGQATRMDADRIPGETGGSKFDSWAARNDFDDTQASHVVIMKKRGLLDTEDVVVGDDVYLAGDRAFDSLYNQFGSVLDDSPDIYSYIVQSNEINMPLRAGEALSNKYQRTKDAIDKATQPLADNIRTFRSADLEPIFGPDVDLDDVVGAVITDRGYTSTTLDRKFAENWTGQTWTKEEGRVLLDLTVPKGSEAMFIETRGGFNAYEMVLPPGAEIRIVDRVGDTLQAEVVPTKRASSG